MTTHVEYTVCHSCACVLENNDLSALSEEQETTVIASIEAMGNVVQVQSHGVESFRCNVCGDDVMDNRYTYETI